MTTHDATERADANPEVRREAKARAARAFDAAVRERGGTNDGVGRQLGVGRTRVQRMRSDDPGDLDATTTLADLLLLDDELYAAVVARLQAERLALYGRPQRATLESELCAAMAAESQAIVVAAGALSDGVVSPGEAADLERVLDHASVAVDRVRGELRARARR